MDWPPACKPEGRRFDSQSGHMPGLQTRSPMRGTQEATTHRCLSASLPPALKINKYFLKKNIRVMSESEVSCKKEITYHHSRQLLLPACPSAALGNAPGLSICWGRNCLSGNYFLLPDHIAWFLPSSKVTATTYSINRRKGFFRNSV